jgi:hypothetical protein
MHKVDALLPDRIIEAPKECGMIDVTNGDDARFNPKPISDPAENCQGGYISIQPYSRKHTCDFLILPLWLGVLKCRNAGILIDLFHSSQSYREPVYHSAGWHDSLIQRHCYISRNTNLDPRLLS